MLLNFQTLSTRSQTGFRPIVYTPGCCQQFSKRLGPVPKHVNVVQSSHKQSGLLPKHPEMSSIFSNILQAGWLAGWLVFRQGSHSIKSKAKGALFPLSCAPWRNWVTKQASLRNFSTGLFELSLPEEGGDEVAIQTCCILGGDLSHCPCDGAENPRFACSRFRYESFHQDGWLRSCTQINEWVSGV